MRRGDVYLVEEYQAWCKLKNEAVAIRDGGKQ